MVKIISFGNDSRAKLKIGVDTLANAVSCTLGPRGKNVVIEKVNSTPHITKDGVTVAKSIELDNPTENMGAQLVKEVASKTNDMAGDGTTTATVLTQAIYNDGLKFVAAGANPMDLKRGIERATKSVITCLKKQSKPIATATEIKQIATISANNDSTIGEMISDAMDKVGKDGVITVEEARGTETEVKTVEGMQFDKGFISPYFVTNQETMECELENPYILLFDRRISAMKDLLPLLEQVANSNNPLLIIADDLEGEALATLVVNKLRGTLKISAVRSPGFGDRRKSILEDIAILTGGSVIDKDKGMELDTSTIDMLGTCEKIIIDKNTTTIINGSGEADLIKSRIDLIKNQITKSTSDYDTEKLQERLAKLAGGVAIIYIGASTEIELKEKKDRVDDALHATRAAVEEGIVVGGGVALLKTLKDFEFDIKTENVDQKLGVKIIHSAIQSPFKTIINNSGLSPDVIMDKVLAKGGNYGYDARTEQYVDMIDAGIIDPTKVQRCALEYAASVAGLLLTTECTIAAHPENNEEITKPSIPVI